MNQGKSRLFPKLRILLELEGFKIMKPMWYLLMKMYLGNNVFYFMKKIIGILMMAMTKIKAQMELGFILKGFSILVKI